MQFYVKLTVVSVEVSQAQTGAVDVEVCIQQCRQHLWSTMPLETPKDPQNALYHYQKK